MSSSEFDQNTDEYEADIVTLYDEQGRSLNCYVRNEVVFDGSTYLLLMPMESTVMLLTMGEDQDDEDESYQEIIILEPDEITPEILETAKAVLAELELSLKHSAYTLTVEGELPPLEEDDLVSLEVEPDQEPEELQYLTSFYQDEEKYSIYTPLTPIMYVGQYLPNGKLELLSPDNELLQPVLDELLADELDELED